MDGLATYIEQLKIEVIKLQIMLNAYHQATMTAEQKETYLDFIKQSGLDIQPDDKTPAHN